MDDLSFLEVLMLILALLGGGGSVTVGLKFRQLLSRFVEQSAESGTANQDFVDKAIEKLRVERRNEIDLRIRDLKDDIEDLKRQIASIHEKLGNGLQGKVSELATKLAELESFQRGFQKGRESRKENHE